MKILVFLHHICLETTAHVAVDLVATDDQPPVPALHLAAGDANAKLGRVFPNYLCEVTGFHAEDGIGPVVV